MSDKETSEFEVAVRLAMSWLLDKGSVPLDSLSDEAQKIVTAISARVPVPGLDHETQALIDTQRREEAEIGKAREIVSFFTGVSYFLEPVRPIGKGVAGKSRLRVEKDRGAWVRSHAIPGRTPQYFADLVIDFDGKATPTADLWPARPAENKGYKSEPPERVRNDVLAFVAESRGASKSAIRRAVKGGNGDIDWALEWLIDHDQVSVEQVGQAKKHYPADPAGTVP